MALGTKHQQARERLERERARYRQTWLWNTRKFRRATDRRRLNGMTDRRQLTLLEAP